MCWTGHLGYLELVQNKLYGAAHDNSGTFNKTLSQLSNKIKHSKVDIIN